MRHLLDHTPPPPTSTFQYLSHVLNTTSNNNNDHPDPVTPSSPYGLDTNFNPSMAIIVVVLLSAFFFMAFFTLYVRRCTTSDGSTGGNARGQGARTYERPPRGLDKALVDSLPLVTFFAGKTKQEETDTLECVVCLSEFQDKETLRLLPKCNHVFHQECIDMWLFSHTSCPVCRRSLLDVGGEGGDTDGATEELNEVAIPVGGSEVLRVDGEGNEANTSGLNAGYTHGMDSPIYGIVVESSSRSKSRNGRGFRRSNSTGHSLVRIFRPLPAAEGIGQRPFPVAIPVPWTSTDFHRSRSYTALSDRLRLELKRADSSKVDPQKGSSGTGSWRTFSFRRAFDMKRAAASSNLGESSLSSEARIGYGEDDTRGSLSSMRRTFMRLTGMGI